MKDSKLYIEILERFNGLAIEQLKLYKELCKHLTEKVEYLEQRLKE